MIYFVQEKDNPEGLIKIGYTKNNPASRLSALQVGSPVELQALHVMEGPQKLELAFHELWKEDRVRGEWFAPKNILRYLEGVESKPTQAGVPRKMTTPRRGERRYIFARKNRFWCRLKNAQGEWVNLPTGYTLEHEEEALQHAKRVQLEFTRQALTGE